MIELFESAYSECSEYQREAFAALNFGQGGNMIRVIAGLKGGDVYNTARPDTRVIWLEDDKVVIGWAVYVDPPMCGFKPEAYYFVHVSRRLQGLGTLLMRASRVHWGKEFNVCRHDNGSTVFFDKTDKV